MCVNVRKALHFAKVSDYSVTLWYQCLCGMSACCSPIRFTWFCIIFLSTYWLYCPTVFATLLHQLPYASRSHILHIWPLLLKLYSKLGPALPHPTEALNYKKKLHLLPWAGSQNKEHQIGWVMVCNGSLTSIMVAELKEIHWCLIDLV